MTSDTGVPGGIIDRLHHIPPSRGVLPVWLAMALFVALGGPLASSARAQPSVDGEEGGCVHGPISSVEVSRHPVFDPESTGFGVLAWTYRALNVLHVTTTSSFVRREILFDEGDCLDPFLLQESERLLDGYGFLASAEITYEDDGQGGNVVFVETRDEWSTKVDVGVTYDESANLEKIEVTEENFLGQGVFAEFTHRERRETRAQSFGLATPRLFGRTDASIVWGRDRPGVFFSQYLRYPFIGETGTWSVRQGYDRGTSFFAYAADSDAPYTQVLAPVFHELVELSAARRFGEPGRSTIVGVTAAREVMRFPGEVNVTLLNDFDELEPYPGELPGRLQRQLRPSSSTRVTAHLGTRRYRYVEYRGIDGLRDRTIVSLGYFAGVSLGKGFAALTPRGVPVADDLFGRVHASFGLPVGSSILTGGFTVESRRDAEAWQDILGDADLVAYLRNDGLRSHTVFLRASLAGGWRTELPYQLSLGGRDGVRSLLEDRFPGGRMMRFIVEDRILFPWPDGGSVDLGMTLFGDVGRVWPGDVPYGVDSGWQSGVGAGLRFGFPAGTRNVVRADIAFPVGSTGGDPVFRMTFEVNRLRDGFFTADVARSRRFNLGPEHF
ncbi:MAG: hypothetical protein R3304_00780 [Longimicrobiales bacterium]|nr:hypothetical protein [Longimicrobiales bacterium]